MKTGQKGISSNFKSPPTFEVFFDAHKSWYVNRCSIFSRYMPTLVMDYLNCSLILCVMQARSSIRLIGYYPSLKGLSEHMIGQLADNLAFAFSNIKLVFVTI